MSQCTLDPALIGASRSAVLKRAVEGTLQSRSITVIQACELAEDYHGQTDSLEQHLRLGQDMSIDDLGLLFEQSDSVSHAVEKIVDGQHLIFYSVGATGIKIQCHLITPSHPAWVEAGVDYVETVVHDTTPATATVDYYFFYKKYEHRGVITNLKEIAGSALVLGLKGFAQVHCCGCDVCSAAGNPSIGNMDVGGNSVIGLPFFRVAAKFRTFAQHNLDLDVQIRAALTHLLASELFDNPAFDRHFPTSNLLDMKPYGLYRSEIKGSMSVLRNPDSGHTNLFFEPDASTDESEEDESSEVRLSSTVPFLYHANDFTRQDDDDDEDWESDASEGSAEMDLTE